METKKYKLTLNIGEWHKSKLDAFCKRTEQNYTEAFKCWVASLPDEPGTTSKNRRPAHRPGEGEGDGGAGRGGG